MSTRHPAATAAPTLLSITRATCSSLCLPATCASTRSPTLTRAAALATEPFTRTWRALHASVAADRVLNNRTAQSH